MSKSVGQNSPIEITTLDPTTLQFNKLQLEVAELKRRATFWGTTLPLIPALLGFLSLGLGLATFQHDWSKERKVDDAKRRELLKAADHELMRPWLDSQRAFYSKALNAATTAAYSDDMQEIRHAKREFQSLYYGELALVETTNVAVAMSNMKAMVENPSYYSRNDRDRACLALATAMHDSMAATAKMSFDEFAANQFRYDVPAKPDPAN